MNGFLTILKYTKYLRPYRIHLFFAIAISLLYSTSNVYFLPLARDLIEAINKREMNFFHNQIFNVIGLFSVRLGTQFGLVYLTTFISTRMSIDMRMDLYKKLQSLSQHFYSEWRIGDIMTRLSGDINGIKDGVLAIFKTLIPQAVTFISVLTYMMFLNWQLTSFTLVTIPLFVWIISSLSSKLKKATKQALRKSSDNFHRIQESLSNIQMVQAYNMEEKEYNRLFQESLRGFFAEMKGVKIQCKTGFYISFLQFLVITLVLWFGGTQVSRGDLSGAELASFFTGVMLLIDPIASLTKVFNLFKNAEVSCERYEEINSFDSRIKDPKRATNIKKISGEIEFKNVSFFYESNPSNKVLDDISFTAKEGDTIALVGLSGAGKTTLINLIPRFYDPARGSITLDGHNLKQLNLYTLRSNIAIVPQEDLLFRGSILDNIRYGTPDATEDDVIKAAKLANAWDFIDALPAKLKAKIGDRGRKLSGGQKQRISIARALLRNPKILLLDEATSALDSESENLVQDALDKLMKNRTTFVIAHRLSTIIHADKIIVMKDGKIAEMGNHDALLKEKGEYFKLYNLQFKNQKTT